MPLCNGAHPPAASALYPGVLCLLLANGGTGMVLGTVPRRGPTLVAEKRDWLLTPELKITSQPRARQEVQHPGPQVVTGNPAPRCRVEEHSAMATKGHVQGPSKQGRGNLWVPSSDRLRSAHALKVAAGHELKAGATSKQIPLQGLILDSIK